MTTIIRSTGASGFVGKLLLVLNDTWTDNSPVPGSITWGAQQVRYNGITFNIAAGTTSNQYIYWNGASSAYSTSAGPPALTDGQFIIATNINGVHSLAYNKIANQQIAGFNVATNTITGGLTGNLALATITAGNIVVGTITAASAIISSIDANVITVNSLRSINVQSSAFMTKGSYLTSASTNAAATVRVQNAADFPASGSAQIIGTTNDRNTFTYTSKTTNFPASPDTLNGCAGVLANNNGSTVIPVIKDMVIDDNVNEMRFFGPQTGLPGGAVIELASIGTNALDGSVGVFGSLAIGTTLIGVIGFSNSNNGVYGSSVSSGGVVGTSTTGNGGVFSTQSGSTTGSALELILTTTGNFVINFGATKILTPAGFYNLVDVTGDSGTTGVVYEILVGGVWKTPGINALGNIDPEYSLFGTFYFDGTNQRLNNLDAGGAHTIFWQRM
jgi:hypothetical protein